MCTDLTILTSRYCETEISNWGSKQVVEVLQVVVLVFLGFSTRVRRALGLSTRILRRGLELTLESRLESGAVLKFKTHAFGGRGCSRP